MISFHWLEPLFVMNYSFSAEALLVDVCRGGKKNSTHSSFVEVGDGGNS